MIIPTVNSYNGSTYLYIGNNPTYSYPIKLEGNFCYPEELNECLNNKELSNDCCDSLYDENTWPEETVTVTGEFLLVISFVILFTLIRVRLWKTVTKRNGINYSLYYWLLVIWDTLLGVFISFLYCYAITNYLKVSVSSPRPIYYSLKIYGSIHQDHREKLRSKYFIYFLFHCLFFHFFHFFNNSFLYL